MCLPFFFSNALKSHIKEQVEKIRSLLAIGLEDIKGGKIIPYTFDFMDKSMTLAVENSKVKKPIRDEVEP